ncbi:MAG: PEP/pyruvate-binding domain-containing protein, partial [Nitrospira sp.]|nr:PEP/pyruvate-binding domain-containing protein [Nitrospira sp.]
MALPLILPLSRCLNPALVGGKAVGLARLLMAGFPVPPGMCITTEAYRQSLKRLGLDQEEDWKSMIVLPEAERNTVLSNRQSLIRSLDISDLASQCITAFLTIEAASETSFTKRWAIHSSATNEDASCSSFAGLYRTHLGVASGQLEAAIKDLWASVWHERVVRYTIDQRPCQSAPLMAVIIQPMLNPLAAGVAHSVHPVTGRSFHVVINAIPGLASPLVDGLVTPDQFVVEMWKGQQTPWIR